MIFKCLFSLKKICGFVENYLSISSRVRRDKITYIWISLHPAKAGLILGGVVVIVFKHHIESPSIVRKADSLFVRDKVVDISIYLFPIKDFTYGVDCCYNKISFNWKFYTTYANDSPNGWMCVYISNSCCEPYNVGKKMHKEPRS